MADPAPEHPRPVPVLAWYAAALGLVVILFGAIAHAGARLLSP